VLGIMSSTELQIKVLGIIIVLMLIGYFWLRHGQLKRQKRLLRYTSCKDLILNKRHALASAGADLENLVALVKMAITPEQLEAVIELLTAPRVQYNIDSLEDPESLEVNLDFEKDDSSRKRQKDDKTVQETKAPQPTELDMSSFDEKDEDAWFKIAHNRFRQAAAAKNITDRRDRVKLLVAMVELGRKAVEEDSNKPGSRKAYERELWDRFYEKEYLDINA
jgi:hypothetical protein